MDRFAQVSSMVAATDGSPIWWSESYSPAQSETSSMYSNEVPAKSGVAASGSACLARPALPWHFIWDPQANGRRCVNCLWTDPDLGPALRLLDVPGLALRSRSLPRFP